MLDSKIVYSAALFVVAYLIVMGVLVYGLNLPYHITRNQALVNEYYFSSPWFSLGMDFVFIVLYWFFAYTIWKVLDIQSVSYQGLIFVTSTAFLTSVFWWHFTRTPVTNAFFSRWFHGVGARSILYDVVLLGTLFVVYQLLILKIRPVI